MNIEVLKGAAIGIMVISLVKILRGYSVRVHLGAETSESSTRVYVLSAVPRAAAIGLLLFFVFVNLLLWFVAITPGPEWVVVKPAFTVASLCYGCWMALTVFRFRIIQDSDALLIRQFASEVRVPFAQILRVDWNPVSSRFRITTTQHSVEVSVFLVGIRRLLRDVEVLAPNADVDEANDTLLRFSQ